MRKLICRWLATSAMLLTATVAAEPGAAPAAVAEGKEVDIEYTLTLEDGSVADSNVGQAPLTYTHGSGQLLPALEAALLGLQPGDSKRVQLAAADAYGEVNPEAREQVPLTQIPEASRQVGAKLVASSMDGRRQQVEVVEVNDDHVVIDVNHPLAGEDLSFEVKVVAVR